MRRISTALVTVVCVLSSVTAFGQSAPANPSITVPRLIQISGVFQPVDGQPPSAVEIVTLSVYAEAAGGLPVWQEQQTVAIEKTTGRFTLLLGASHPAGIPAEVFASGDGQWMSLLFERAGEREQARVRIASVPYALKASDAETLGGLPASAYLRAPTAASTDGISREPSTTTSTLTVTEAPSLAAVLPGTTNFLAKYVNTSDVGNSAVYETPTAAVPTGAVGIGTTAPLTSCTCGSTTRTARSRGSRCRTWGIRRRRIRGRCSTTSLGRSHNSRASTTSPTNTGSTTLRRTRRSTS